MEKQEITLSLPGRLLGEIERLAARRQISVSDLLVEVLEEMVDEGRGYERARQRQLALMQQGLDLGLGEGRPAPGEELHER
ncbi:MAG: CopG family transcriptional regulator [Chloroflexota bacterium]